MPRAPLAPKTKKPSARVKEEDTKTGPLLLRFRRDSPTGVTRNTLKRAATELGMNETQLIHMAVRVYIRHNLPSYDVDAPQITDADIERLRSKYPQTVHGRVLSSIYTEPVRKARK